VRKKGDVPILEITTTNFRSDRISLTGKKMWRKMWRKQSVKWLGGWIARTAGPLGVPFTESLHQQKTASATSTASSESCVFTQYDAVDQKTSHLVACGRLRVLTSCQIMMVSAAVTPAMTCDQLSEVSSYNHSDFTIEINHQSIGYGTAWFYTSLRRCFYRATAIAIMSVCLLVYHVPELYRKVLIHVYHNTFSAYGTQPFCFPTTKYLRISDGITPYGGVEYMWGIYISWFSIKSIAYRPPPWVSQMFIPPWTP